MLSAQFAKGDKFINLAAAACRLMLVLLCVDVLTVGQRCFYGMVMELETFPFHGYQSLGCLVLSLIFFTDYSGGYSTSVKTRLKWAFGFWFSYNRNLQWNFFPQRTEIHHL